MLWNRLKTEDYANGKKKGKEKETGVKNNRIIEWCPHWSPYWSCIQNVVYCALCYRGCCSNLFILTSSPIWDKFAIKHKTNQITCLTAECIFFCLSFLLSNFAPICVTCRTISCYDTSFCKRMQKSDSQQKNHDRDEYYFSSSVRNFFCLRQYLKWKRISMGFILFEAILDKERNTPRLNPYMCGVCMLNPFNCHYIYDLLFLVVVVVVESRTGVWEFKKDANSVNFANGFGKFIGLQFISFIDYSFPMSNRRMIQVKSNIPQPECYYYYLSSAFRTTFGKTMVFFSMDRLQLTVKRFNSYMRQ